MRDNIPDALIAAFERQYDSSWNDPQLRNQRLAMRYGWAAAMEAKQCLHQIQEPASNHSEIPSSSVMPNNCAAAVAVPDEREAFEAWAREYGTWDVERDDVQSIGIASYTDVAVVVAWHAWQARAALAATPQNHIADAGQMVENVREGAPYENPAFEKLARELGVWGTAQSAICAQFWMAATPAADAPENAWQQAFDKELVSAHLGVAGNVTPAEAEKALHELICWNIEVAINPKTNGGKVLVPAAATVLPEPRWHNPSPHDAAHFPYYTPEDVRALLTTGGQAQAHAVEQEPFGYFKAEPFGWTDCGPDDEGAVALYERPQAQADARDAEGDR